MARATAFETQTICAAVRPDGVGGLEKHANAVVVRDTRLELVDSVQGRECRRGGSQGGVGAAQRRRGSGRHSRWRLRQVVDLELEGSHGLLEGSKRRLPLG